MFNPFDTGMFPSKFRNSGPTVTQKAVDLAHKVIKQVPIIPDTMNPVGVVDTIVQAAEGAADGVVNLATSKQGEKVLKLGAELFGTAIHAAVAA